MEELRQDRDTLLALFHALFFVRGVRHLDSDLTDPDWYPGSAAHLNGASLGGFADCHREVMEEYVPIRAREHAASPSDDDDYAELLASLGTLRAKAKDATGAAEMFLRAATERDRRRDARSARASELKEAEQAYEEALTRRDAVRAEADAKTVSFDGPARTPRTRAEDQKRAEALRKSIEEADAAVEAAHERCMRAAAAVQSDARARRHRASQNSDDEAAALRHGLAAGVVRVYYPAALHRDDDAREADAGRRAAVRQDVARVGEDAGSAGVPRVGPGRPGVGGAPHLLRLGPVNV